MIKKKIKFNELPNIKVKFGEKIRTGGAGSDDYNDLINKPKINGNTLRGDQTLVALGLLNNLLAGTGITIGVEDGRVKISADGLGQVQFRDIQGEPRDNLKLDELISALENAKLSKVDTGYHEKRLYAVNESGEQIMVSWSELPQGSVINNYIKGATIRENTITFNVVRDGVETQEVFNVNLDRYATIEYVDRAIATSTGKFIGNFQTYAELLTYITTELNNNDYAIVLADETHENETWRYKWVVEGEQGEWRAEYKISSTPLTEEQLLALNSTITLTKVQLYDNHIHNNTIHLSSEDREKLADIDNKVDKRGDTMEGSLNFIDDEIVIKATTSSIMLGLRFFLNDTEKASLYYDYNNEQLLIIMGLNVLRFPRIEGDKTIAVKEEVDEETQNIRELLNQEVRERVETDNQLDEGKENKADQIDLDGIVDKSTGQLTEGQGEVLIRSIRNFIIVNDKYPCYLRKFDYDTYTATYVCNLGGSYVAIEVNMQDGTYIAYIKEMQRKMIAGENITITYDEDGNPTISSTGGGSGSSDLIEKGSYAPRYDRPIGKLYEEDTYGALYQMTNREAGVYDGRFNLIAKWDDLGINDDCSNAGDIISRFADARIVIISDRVVEIASLGFNGANQITKLFVPDSVETIHSYAFNGMYALEEISLPYTGNMKSGALSQHLFGVIFDNSANENVNSNQQYYDNAHYLWTYTPKTLWKVIIRSSPDDISTNQSRSFCGMNGISEVILINAKVVEPRMFKSMASLNSLTIYANGSLNFGISAIQYTNVQTLILPKETNVIRNIETISELHLLSTTPPALLDTTRPESLTYIGVPTGCREVYLENENWALFQDIIVEEDIAVAPFHDETKEWVYFPNSNGFKTINGYSILGQGNIEINVPTRTSELINDSGFLTEHQSLDAYRTAEAQDEIDRNKEDSSNKTDTIEASSTKYPTCNAVIEYIAQLNGDNDEF